MDDYIILMVLIPNMILFFVLGKYHERWEWNKGIKAGHIHKGVSDDQRRAKAQLDFMNLNEISNDG
jgi:hypothetical protein